MNMNGNSSRIGRRASLRGQALAARIGLLMTLVPCVLSIGWPSVGSAATYVVDPGNPAADDRSPGTEDKPFRTLQKGADAAQAGDTVCVMEGNYPERVTLKNSGAEGKPIVFRSCPRRGAEVYGFTTGKADWVRIEGFRIHGPKPERMVVGIFVTSNHVEILDNCFYGLYGAIFLDYSGSPGKDKEPVSPSDTHIAYNEIYQCQECVWLFGCRCVFENNYIHRVTHQGISGDADYMRPFGVDQTIRYNTLGGTKRDEIGPAHLDCFQYFDTNGHHGRRFEVCYNVLYDFGEAFMGEMKHSTDLAGDWTFHHNVAHSSYAWGICDIGIPRVKSLCNTWYDMTWHGVGITGYYQNNQNNRAEGGVIRDNIFQKIDLAIKTDANASPQQDHNVFFQCRPGATGEKDLVNVDPKMADPNGGNFRLAKGSPAIGAASDGGAIGALEYPNVYYVDPRHPAATDEGFGYAGQPYKTLAKGMDVAQAGETIVVRGGAYREALRAKNDGVTVRAMKGEKVMVSGADLIEGWKRTGKGWEAPLPSRPKTVLRDGRPWTEFAYDAAAKTITVKTGGDPRLHVYETVVRAKPVGTDGRKDVKVEGIEVVDVLTE
jgi:hypothetical protein